MASRKLERKLGGIVIIAAFLLGSLYILPLGIRCLVYGTQSLRWPQTTGVITLSEVEVTKSQPGGLRGSPNRRQAYWANVECAYEVEGENYRTSQIAYDTNGGKAAAAQYQIGQKVTVYYKPSQPSEAVLEPGRRWGGFLLCFFGLASLGSFILATLVVFRHWRDL